MSAFGDKVSCNLCAAEGKTFFTFTTANGGAWAELMQVHTETEHPEHEEQIRRQGEIDAARLAEEQKGKLAWMSR